MARASLLAAVLVAAGSFCFSLMGLFVKLAGRHTRTTTFSLLAVRSMLGLVLNSFVVLAHRLYVEPEKPAGEPQSAGERSGVPACGRAWQWLAVRSLGGFACIILEYAALKVLPLAVNTMIVYSSPAFIVMWAALLLGEPVRFPVIVCLCTCFAGLVLIVQPWHQDASGVPSWAYAAALVSAVLAGLVYVSLRELKGVSYHFILTTFMVSCLALSVATGLALDRLPLPPLRSPAWGYLLAVGGAAYAAEVCVTIGYARAANCLGQVSVLKFLSPIFSTMWGTLFLGEVPTSLELVGAVMVLGASAAIIYQGAHATRPSAQPGTEGRGKAEPACNMEGGLSDSEQSNERSSLGSTSASTSESR